MQKYFLLLIMTIFSMQTALAAPPARKAAPAARKPGAAPANNGASTAAMNGYLNRLRGKLLNNWTMPDGKNHVVITAIMNNDGTVESFDTKGSPATNEGTQAANDAFAKVQPFEALPSGINKAKVTLTFISTADPHGDSSSNVTTEMLPIKEPKPAAEAAPPAEQK
jgi:hypothetical protein